MSGKALAEGELECNHGFMSYDYLGSFRQTLLDPLSLFDGLLPCKSEH